MKIEIYKRRNWLGLMRFRWRLLGNNNKIVLPQEAFNSLQALEHNLSVAKRGLIEYNKVFGEGFDLSAKDEPGIGKDVFQGDPVSPGAHTPKKNKK